MKVRKWLLASDPEEVSNLRKLNRFARDCKAGDELGAGTETSRSTSQILLFRASSSGRCRAANFILR